MELEEFLNENWNFGKELRDFEVSQRESAFKDLTNWRRQYSNFLEWPNAQVLAPRCATCCRGTGTSINSISSWEFPHISRKYWNRNLRKYGIDKAEIAQINKEDSVQCWVCCNKLVYGEDSFYVDRVSFERFFGPDLLRGSEGRMPPKWMKQFVFDTYEGRCFGCGKGLSWESPESREIDHIRPYSEEKITSLFNLQLLCRNPKSSCSISKGGVSLKKSTHALIYRVGFLP